jgi:hypothetical protein
MTEFESIPTCCRELLRLAPRRVLTVSVLIVLLARGRGTARGEVVAEVHVPSPEKHRRECEQCGRVL